MLNEIIVVSQPEAAVIALNEIQKIDPGARGQRLSKGMQLVTTSLDCEEIWASKPIFIQQLGKQGAGGKKNKEPEISRAEFKLQEALACFDIKITDPNKKSALDLGAAPGGWTKVLLDKGMQVTAVDPAELSDKINRHPNLTHAREAVQKFLRQSSNRSSDSNKYDILLNDMRMDAKESCQIMQETTPILKPGAQAIMTLKLQHSHWYKQTKRALSLLEKSYTVQGARQLPSNKSEVTIHLST